MSPAKKGLVLIDSTGIELTRMSGHAAPWLPDVVRLPHVRLLCFEGEARLSPSDCRALAKRLEELAAELDKGMHRG